MAKNSRNRKGETKRGKSQRWGNAPSPYSKYGKRPHVYSSEYQNWNARAKSGKSHEIIRTQPAKQQWLQAAE